VTSLKAIRFENRSARLSAPSRCGEKTSVLGSEASRSEFGIDSAARQDTCATAVRTAAPVGRSIDGGARVLTSSAHFGCSAATKAAISWGVLPTRCEPRSPRRDRISWLPTMTMISEASRATTGAGSPAGSKLPIRSESRQNVRGAADRWLTLPIPESASLDRS
jgi:hypothetical protein